MHRCVLVSLTAAVNFVWGSEELVQKKGFGVRQDFHSLGCELYSVQEESEFNTIGLTLAFGHLKYFRTKLTWLFTSVCVFF